MKTNFNSDNELSVNNPIKLSTIAIVFRAISLEYNKYYPRVFLDKCLYEL